MRRPLPIVFVAAALSAAWLGMTALHELGHVLNAWLSGGHVTSVELPPRGLGHTLVSPNPHPQFVAWGGACWGSVLSMTPMLFTRRRALVQWFARFFAGMCLIANGVYVGLGGFFGDRNGADDAHELLRQGAPVWQLVVFGALAMAAGLAVWHRLGPRIGLSRAADEAGWKTLAVLVFVSGSLLCLGLLLR